MSKAKTRLITYKGLTAYEPRAGGFISFAVPGSVPSDQTECHELLQFFPQKVPGPLFSLLHALGGCFLAYQFEQTLARGRSKAFSNFVIYPVQPSPGVEDNPAQPQSVLRDGLAKKRAANGGS